MSRLDSSICFPGQWSRFHLSPASSGAIFSAIFPLKLSPSSCNVPYPTGWVGSEASLAKPMRMLVGLTSWKYNLFNIENLVRGARSVLIGFAGRRGFRHRA
jgi:hypothetical protein